MIFVNHGKDWTKATRDVLAASDIGRFLKPGMAVAIKPNLVTAQPAANGATTHPEVVEGIVMFLKDFGIRDVSAIENSAVGHSARQAFRTCGYEALKKKHGIRLVDLESDRRVTTRAEGIDIQVCALALETDFLINAPVLKAHSQTRMTCCMKNLKGCIPQSEMRRFHALGLHKPIAALNAVLKTGYCVVDGICGDLSFEEGGTPVEANRIVAGRNPALVDSFCAGLVGYEPDDIEHLSLGRKMGIGEYCSRETKVTELNPHLKPPRQARIDRIADRYGAVIDEDAACSACHAALVFALSRKGASSARAGKISIGQGHKGKSGDGLGVGDCASGFRICAKGCPPRAIDILPFL